MELIEGTVGRIIFRDPDGYTVLELTVVGRLLPVTVVGSLAGVQPGETLKVQGTWTRHARFGEQFRAAGFEARVPESEQGLLRYLASGAVAGIGPGLAARLVERFGAELFDVAESQPHRLREVEGIGSKRAASMARALAEQRAIRDVMVFLQGLELGPALAARIYRTMGEQTVSLLKADPYQLVERVDGVGFATADALARRLGVTENSPSRLAAGLLHLVGQARDLGDTVVPKEELVRRVTEFLGCEQLALEAVLDGAIARGLLAERPGPDDVRVGLASLVRSEETLARRLAELGAQPAREVPDALVERCAAVELSGEQRAAVGAAARGSLTVITGGPGTGKTTVVRALVKVLEALGDAVHLCAPTGRAAKRLSEAAERPAGTVHRLLGFGGGRFAFGRTQRLPAGTIVLDEASMLDVPLGRSLVEALSPGSRLVFVGDADQLPSVGPGNVLADLIASAVVPVQRLTVVFRQAASSRIVVGAHRIREGELPEASPAGSHERGDLHIVSVEDPDRAQALILEICCERIPKAFGLDPSRDVQVLSPMHRGSVGTTALNRLLQERLNRTGRGIKRAGDELRVGDKVMQVRNDYERDVFNGDVGWIASLDLEDGDVEVELNGLRVRYRADQLEQLALAYCVSIHKSQGSEYPAVVVPLLTQHYVLLQRNLLYTAVTRAKTLAVLVCSPQALKLAVTRADPSQRRTLLAAVLRDTLSRGR
ncbi:MAG: ATP-dependent RecD-like DNA helicase [Deltaproteobacteria bacterium]|nr:ATP-dependent RecD-like DNA helicase [Deltaproteobacteria bacterium]